MPLITLTQNLGSGGIGIARRVAEQLNMELFDDDRLQAEAREMGIRTDDLKSLDESAPGLFDRLIGRKPEMYLDLMEAVVYKVARNGEGVIIGHGGQMLLRDFGCALHVRVHSSEKQRTNNLMEKNNLSRKAAQKLIRKSDNERNGFFKFAFHMDLNDPSLYDLIINTGKISRETAARFIVDLASAEEISTCSLTALEAMEKLSLLKKVEAELLKHDVNTAMLQFEVSENGLLDIHGITTAPNEKDRIIKVIQGIPEIKDFNAEIAVVQDGY
jgi:cytidylate kinase